MTSAPRSSTRRIFSLREIYGTASPWPWSSPYPLHRPFTDAENSSETVTIAGASALRVTFDPDGTIITRSIDPGLPSPTDNLILMDEGTAVSVIYDDRLLAPTRYTIMLTVTDDSGQTAATRQNLWVHPHRPRPTGPLAVWGVK